MKMDAPLVIAGLFLLIFVILWIIFIKLGRQPDQYDERQLIGRAKAYQSAFAAVCIWEVLYCAVRGLNINIPVTDSVMVVSGVLVGVGVFAIRCVLTDSYFPINQSKNCQIGTLLAIGMINVGIGIMNTAHGQGITDGKLNYHALSFLVGLLMLAVVGSVLIRRLVCKADEDKDPGEL